MRDLFTKAVRRFAEIEQPILAMIPKAKVEHIAIEGHDFKDWLIASV